MDGGVVGVESNFKKIARDFDLQSSNAFKPPLHGVGIGVGWG